MGIAWVPVVLACVFNLRPMAWLAARPLRVLGAVSFGTYLLHPVIISGAAYAGLAGRAWAGPIILPAVIFAAWLAHIIIEKPALRAADWCQPRRRGVRLKVDTVPDHREVIV